MPDLSLTLLRHRLAAGRDASRRTRPAMAKIPRPDGRLLWVHFGSGAAAQPVKLVLARLQDELEDLSILTTGNDASGPLSAPAPVDTFADAAAFLDQWRPSTALFCGNDPFPTLWDAALARGVPLLAAETDPARIAWPLIRAMQRFDAVMARTADPRLGAVLEVAGPLARVASPPTANTASVLAATERIGARPVWLALQVPADELTPVLSAHRRAAQMTHRLLLILLTRESDAARTALGASDLRWQDKTPEAIASDTQVILVGDDPGLWLRICPVVFLGGTLRRTGEAVPAGMAAGLGSAILTGPHTDRTGGILPALLAADGARRVADAGALGAQVERLLNPEEAAALAHNAWTVTTEGAEASARLFELLDDTLAGVPD